MQRLLCALCVIFSLDRCGAVVFKGGRKTNKGDDDMTDIKMNPEEFMDAMEALAKANGYGIKSVKFAPRSQPSNSSVDYAFSANHLMAADFTTGYQVMMDAPPFTTKD
jgi:hypothetical protein